jgi:hypothetical protein
MSQKSSLTQSAYSVRQVLTAYIASQAFALPCPHGTWQGGHYVCADFDE